MRKDKTKEFRELVQQAFDDARAKGKPNWRTMEVSVLKNRLLQRTDRRFREADYGADTMAELVASVPDLLVAGRGPRPTVSLREASGDPVPLAAEPPSVADGGRGQEDTEAGFQAVLDRYRTNGDNLGVGEAYASRLNRIDEGDIERTFVNVVSRWASSSPVDVEVNGVGDLLKNTDKFVNDLLALAVVHATLRMEDAGRELPRRTGDLYYRVADSLRSLFGIPAKANRAALVRTSTAKTREAQAGLRAAVERFCQSSPVAAKLPSTDVIKQAHAYERYALVGERQTLREVEVLLGALFRKFCESCERYEAKRIPRRARDLRDQLQRALDSLGTDMEHRLRREVLEPVVKHMSRLIDEGTRASDEMMTPALAIASGAFKLDLGRNGDNVVFPARVVNDGDGTAHAVRIRASGHAGGVTLAISDPPEPFELGSRAERLIRLELGNPSGDGLLEIDAVLTCDTVNGRELAVEQRLQFEQQAMQPDWDGLLRDPPYGINPIRDRKDLYGRDVFLSNLELDVSNETSIFLWGRNASARPPCYRC